MKNPLTLASSVVVSRQQVSCDLVGEVAILNTRSGVYFGLDVVGARIWELIQQPTTVESVRDALLREFDVEPERCERDLFRLLNELETHGLIEVR